jgi:hypothetical protein
MMRSPTMENPLNDRQNSIVAGREGFPVGRKLAGLLSLVVFCLLALSFCAGCIVVPVRAPTRTGLGASSVSPDKKLDLGFLQKGTTTRQEVVEKLGWMDTGIKNERVFLGRWISSKWGVLWGVGGAGAAESGWGRVWGVQDLLVDFDERGVVQQHRLIPDGQLGMTLTNWVTEGQFPPTDLSSPVELTINGPFRKKFCDCTLALGRDAFELHGTYDKKELNLSVAPTEILGMSLSSALQLGTADPDPHSVVMHLHFMKETSVGKTLTINANIPTVVILSEYLRQTKLPAQVPQT